MNFKPMLAPPEDPLSFPEYFEQLQFPLLASPKFDGIRCLIKNHTALSRSGKSLPSAQVQAEFTDFNNLDGELIEGNPQDFGVYNRTQSFVMSQDKPGDMRYYVFDYCHPDWLNKPFYERLSYAKGLLPRNKPYYMIEHSEIENLAELYLYEELQLKRGFEGIMMRNPLGRYKNGRGTFREGLIYKLKRFVDDEARIVGFKEANHNTNVATTDELGYTSRSSHQANLVPADTLGAFFVEHLFKGVKLTLEVACGAITHEERKFIFTNQHLFLGKLLKFRYMLHGMKDRPRFPRAVGLRDLTDLSWDSL